VPGLGLAGLVIEAITGLDLDQMLQKDICEPLGLTRTTFNWTPDSRDLYGFRDVELDVKSPWRMQAVSSTADAPFGDVTLVTCADEYARMLGEILRAIKGKPNKLLRNASTGKLLLEHQCNAKAFQGLHGFLKFNWAYREGIDDVKAGDHAFGLGYLVNLVDMPTGRRAGSGHWEGLTGPTGIVCPEDDVALHMFHLC
jgi:CubicO group peptidase (beta-lactamase class C family)